MHRVCVALYVLLLGALSVHLYRSPVYPMDTIGYMGNALLMEHLDTSTIHQLVYAEVDRMPAGVQRDLLGSRESSDPTQDSSRQIRAKSVESFGEFLPCFAIRPLYNQLLYILSLIVGLRRAAILLAVVPYFLLGLLVFLWCERYLIGYVAAAFSAVLMLTPPITLLGRSTLPDALSTLLALCALFLIFEIDKPFPGLLLLIGSIFVRTDSVVLVAPVLAALWLAGRLDFWKAAALGLLSVLSVLSINHFAGDYGLAMLYYRNFEGTPSFPAEMNLHLSAHGYIAGFHQGISWMMESPLPEFLLLGLVGLYRKSPLLPVALVTTIYALLHFLVLPNWVDRWFVLTYVALALSSICVRPRVSFSVPTSAPASAFPRR
jgi:hypothetical protein